jgi:glycosyltransferase involved in cell wall biosynthesis
MEKAGLIPLNAAQQILVLDRFMQARLVAKSIPLVKLHITPVWPIIDNTIPSPQAINDFKTVYNIENKFIIMYSGNHSVCHPLTIALHAASNLAVDDSIRFLFIGGGVRVREVTEYATQNNLSNILQLPYQPRVSVPVSLAVADIHVVVMGEQFIGIIHPCKIYGIMAAGKPFILVGPKENHITDIIHESGVGFHVQHGDVAGFTEKILEVKNMTATQRAEIGKRGQDYVFSNFSRTKCTQTILDIITSNIK